MNILPVKHIAIYGAGLAGTLCASALASLLPDDIDLSLIDVPGDNQKDIFFGTMSSPTIYDFLLNIGVTEPDLLPNTHTTFSLGTRYLNWGKAKRSWIQSFHKPLPVFQGVSFHHYLTRLRNISPQAAQIEAYIMTARAADKGVFAHPPENKRTPLSNMEYGYQFSPKEWCAFLSQKIESSRINRVSGNIVKVEREHDQIRSITLTNDQRVEAELYIDCTGLHSKITQAKILSRRKLKAITSFKLKKEMSHACHLISGADYGWHSETVLQNGKQRLTIYDPTSEKPALEDHGTTDMSPVEAIIGYVDKPWQGNCLAFGQSAATLEPLTPAPIMLLQRDIVRLTELIPHTTNMTVEAQEYNRRFSEDYSHASLFQRGLFEKENQNNGSYWKTATSEPIDKKLANKITQFQSRGILVQYDLEPFSTEDWTQQHFGMVRMPQRYDPLADRANEHQILQTLEQMRKANENLAKKMPPQDIYIQKLLEYFRKKND